MKVKPKKKKKPVKKKTPKLRLKIEYVSPDDVELWVDNPRKNERAAKKIARLIEAHGFGQPVTVREEDGVVYKGNTRIKAARLLGLDEIPIMRRSYPDVEAAKRDALADNRAQEMAQWDEDALAEMFQEREEVDLERLAAETGFEEVEIEGLRSGVDVSSIDPNEEWNGMPDYDHEDQTSFRRIIVHFKDQADIDRFSKLVRQKFTPKTRSIWYPKATIGTIADKRYGE